jgi:hypothetical protein
VCREMFKCFQELGKFKVWGLAIESASQPSRSRNWQCGITLTVKGNGARSMVAWERHRQQALPMVCV